MATWKQVVNYVKKNYLIEDADDKRIRVRVNPWTDAVGDDELRLVLMYNAELAGTQWIQIETAIGEFNRLPLAPLLEETCTMVCGGVGAIPNVAVTYRHSIMTKHLVLDDLDESIMMVAVGGQELADKYLAR